MKRIITAVMAIVFAAASVFGLAPSAAAQAFLPHTDTASAIAEKAVDDMNYAGFCGRLSVPQVGLNVAMYSSPSQSVCDREDSACCFNLSSYAGYIIADHNNQDFAVLPQVSAGTVGGIIDANGDVTFIVCTDVFQGHNTGSKITDGDYNNVLGTADYLMYTCLDCWQNVQICRWSVIGSWSGATQSFSGFDGCSVSIESLFEIIM